MKEDFKDGDLVIVSWKEDEGNGSYSNKRKKRGTVRTNGASWWVETLINQTVQWHDLTSIRLDPSLH